MTEDKIMTVEEVAKYLRVHFQTVLKLLRDGSIRAQKVGRSWRILKSEVDKY
ncbi:MAG: helix-turn-helix domain-containing protein, partial [Calditrichia bacterium]|nr:helix-turn-helix domain-containing protein [Calditrichia bacterium]